MNSDLKFYIALALRRLPVMLILFLFSLGIGVSLAMFLPPRYEANARLLVENAQIPGEMVVSTVQTSADKQLQIIEERLMTRANMIDVANKYRVFDDTSDMEPTEIVEIMKRLTDISVLSGNRERATVMTISFQSNDPRIAADVVNEFVTLVESSSAQIRQSEAGETAEFFDSEVKRLSEELARRSAEIVRFKEANKDALPEELQYRLERQAQLQERMNLAARDRVSLSEQRNRLLALGQASGLQAPALTPAQQRLADLKNELNGMLSIYSDSNPRVKMLRGQIEQLEASMTPTGGGAQDIDPVQNQIDVQVAEIESRIEFIDAEVQRGEAELERLRAAIEKTPENAIRLEALEREYEISQSQYDRAVTSLNAAKVSESIEVQGKGERVSVIERAIPPTRPSGPKRKLIAGGGVFVGTALALVFFALTELLNRSIRRPLDLTRALGVQPLATIPYIERESVRRRRRAFGTVFVILLLIAFPVALWAVHTYYLPLDLLADQFLKTLGL